MFSSGLQRASVGTEAWSDYLRFSSNYYTPVPLVTVSASHKTSSEGESQDQLGLLLNYRFGVALSQQLSPDNVAARSLRGSRYDTVTRSSTPVLEPVNTDRILTHPAKVKLPHPL